MNCTMLMRIKGEPNCGSCNAPLKLVPIKAFVPAFLYREFVHNYLAWSQKTDCKFFKRGFCVMGDGLCAFQHTLLPEMSQLSVRNI
jgi:hypothetical protein